MNQSLKLDPSVILTSSFSHPSHQIQQEVLLIQPPSRWRNPSFLPTTATHRPQPPPCFPCFLFSLQPILHTLQVPVTFRFQLLHAIFFTLMASFFHINLHRHFQGPTTCCCSCLKFHFAPFSHWFFCPFPSYTCLREFAQAVLSDCNTLPSFNHLQDHYCIILLVLSHATFLERPSLNSHPPLLFCLLLIFSKIFFTICNHVLI